MKLHKSFQNISFILLSIGLGTFAAFPRDSIGADGLDIPYQKFVLKNGLTLIVHEDKKAPIVSVNVWYHVGSKDEKPGKTGFAHLFEHLMFNGSEHYKEDYFTLFDRVGATGLNGTTNCDRTNYFQNVPKSAVDVALWMESDRMGHLLGAISKEKLDEEREVVKNEKCQVENEPYGRVFNLISENAYPEGHPYSWPTIGYIEDIDNTGIEDIQKWFRTYYGAGNAVISIAGDVDTETIKKKVEKYFGNIPSGPPLAKQKVWIAKRTGIHRQILQDRVPHARIYKVWNIPESGSYDADMLNLVSEVFSSDKSSRLYKRLVYKDQIATDVSAFVWLREIGGLFIIAATLQPGHSLDEVESALDEELKLFIRKGPSRNELKRVKIRKRADFIRGMERIGGMGGKSDILARNEVYMGDPSFYKEQLKRIIFAKKNELQEAAMRWLSDGEYILEVHPFKDGIVSGKDADRTKLPETGEFPEIKFPELVRARLENGLEIILAERHAAPVIDFNMLLDAGFASDQFSKPGVAGLSMDMLDEGTKSMTTFEISDRLSLLGANLSADSNLDCSYITLSSLKENVDDSLDVFADIILNPSFPEENFQRLKKQGIADIEMEKAEPVKIGLRLFPELLYGKDHIYSLPFTGSGTKASISSLDVNDLKKFHTNWFKPNNACLVIVGDTTMEEILPKIDSLFKEWQPGKVPEKKITKAINQKKSTIYLVERPEAKQSTIFAVHLSPPKVYPDEFAIQLMNEVLGGSYLSRINMNLREAKHWSYGANSQIIDTRGQRPFIVVASVQTDKTMESMIEIQKEIKEILGSNPPSSEEIARAKDKKTLTLPGRFETSYEVSRVINEMVRYYLPDDFWVTYFDNIQDIKASQINDAAMDFLKPEEIIWIVVGDVNKIKDKIQESNIGDVRLMDVDGNLL